MHGRKIRIAQVAPSAECAAARVASYLTDELVALGHDVTLFASGPSRARAHTVPRELPVHLIHTEQFDLVHEHTGELRDSRVGFASLTTVHGRITRDDAAAHDDTPLVSTCDAQRELLPRAPWIATVANGLPLDLHREGAGGDYLAFVGRIAPEARLDRAIAIAEATGRKLFVAARIDGDDSAYFKRELAPLMTKRCVRYLGELDDAERGELLRGARGLVVPGTWLEPVGVAVLDALACGTPVVAYRCARELVDDGISGFVADDLDDAIAAVGMLGELPRHAIRRRFEERFSASAMARAYVDVYRELLAAAPPVARVPEPLRCAAGAP